MKGLQKMCLEELKEEARKRGYTEIRREQADAPWVPLASWNGFWAGTGIPMMSVEVQYRMDQDTVIVTKTFEGAEHIYRLR